MSKHKYNWTPAHRKAQAERMRATMAARKQKATDAAVAAQPVVYLEQLMNQEAELKRELQGVQNSITERLSSMGLVPMVP